MTDAPSVLVIGAGSIGARHISNLLAAGASVTVVDPDASRISDLVATGAMAGRLGSGRFDGAIVASPTSAHVEHATLALEQADRVLVEKPLGSRPAELEPLVHPPTADRVAVAYNLRFHQPLVRLAELLAGDTIGPISAVSLWFGSWLPDWRPGTDYRTGYSAQAALGGGILFDAIHEIDLLLWLLGDGDYVVRGAVVSRLGPLEIDVEDTVAAVLTGPRGESATIRLDYLSRRYRRGVEVIGETATARLDWARAVIEVEDAAGIRSEPADDPIAHSYERQTSAFLAWATGGPPMPVGAALGARSVAIAAAIRTAAQ